MNRRGFLKTVLAVGAAPAIVRAESLMKLWVPQKEIITMDAPWVGANAPVENSTFTPEEGWTFTYHASGLVFVYPGVGEVSQVYANGKLLTPGRDYTLDHGGIIQFSNLDLTPYGNRFPAISVKGEKV